MIIDAKKVLLGRLGTVAAKKALLGEKVDIINCEESVVTGKPAEVLKEYRRKFAQGIPVKGPFMYRMPDRFVKRSIRGMLPYKTYRGRKAYENIKCHVGVPAAFKDQKAETIEKQTVDKVPNRKHITVKEICKHVGAKI